MKKKDVFTLSFFDMTEDTYIDTPMKYAQTFYSEEDAIKAGNKALEDYPYPEYNYVVSIDYGEYETESGDIYGEITHSLNIADINKLNK